MTRQLVDMNTGEVQPRSAMIVREETAAMHEVQSGLVIAKKFPRDPEAAYKRIITACSRHSLAEQAIYAYPRGGQTVSGPSIRLAEAMAQAWGNLDVGVRELSQADGESEMEAFAWDLETNVRQRKIFKVKHRRDTKKGSYELEDSRDIYELTANNGARRLRACILGIIPGDIVEAAVKKCEETLAKGEGEPLIDRVRKMIVLFGDLGVSLEALETRLGHKADATIEAEFVALRGIYKSIKDGHQSREAFFELPGAPKPTDETPTEPKPLETPEPEPADTFQTAEEKAQAEKADAAKAVQSVFGQAALQNPRGRSK